VGVSARRLPNGSRTGDPFSLTSTGGIDGMRLVAFSGSGALCLDEERAWRFWCSDEVLPNLRGGDFVGFAR